LAAAASSLNDGGSEAVTNPRALAVVAALLLVVPTLVCAQDGDNGRRLHRNGGAHIRIGRSFNLPEGETLAGRLLVIGGRVTLNGTVEDDVTTVGGAIDVGPTAVVRGDLKAVGGRIRIDPAAQVSGDVDETRNGTIRGTPFPIEIDRIGGRMRGWFAAWLTVVRLSFVFVAGLLISLLAPGLLRTVRQQVTTAPGMSLLTGFATEILLTPLTAIVVVALVITIVGIPLLAAVPVLLGALMLLWLVGFVAIAARLGAAIRSAPAERPVTDFAIGFLAIAAVTLIARVVSAGTGGLFWVALPLGGIGVAIEYVAWTIGLGAALLALFNRRRGLVPPPLPPRMDDAPASAPA
jgi:hypothetical protein